MPDTTQKINVTKNAEKKKAEKKQLRQQLLQTRRLAIEHYRKDTLAQDKLLALFRNFLQQRFNGCPPSPCGGYLPIRDELDPRPLMEELRLKHTSALLLPVVENAREKLSFRAFDGNEENLEQGDFNTLHPPPSADTQRPAMLLVPLLGFDASCSRLGYGGGFYDRTLAAMEMEGVETGADKQVLPFTLGIALEAQRLPALPHEEHDRRLDAVLSETRLYTAH